MDKKKLITDLKKTISENLTKTIETANYPEDKELVELINQIILNYKNAKNENIKTKALILDDIDIISGVLQKISLGNFETEISALKTVGFNDLKLGINDMINNLKNIISQLKTTITEISSSSTEIASTNEEIVVKANEEIKLATESSTTVTELTSSIKQVADTTNKVCEKSEKSLKTVKAGHEYLEEIKNKVKGTNEVVTMTSDNLVQLNESAKEIQQILEIINKISEKSDLLALNATIEASGAGESGRRFRVVADEMRKLADNSMKSSHKIEGVLKSIQKGINNSVEMMKNNVKEVEIISSSINRIGEIMGNMLKAFEETYQLSKEVSLSTNQQAKATVMFSDVIGMINISAQETLKGIENSQISINRFIDISSNLNIISEKFQV